MLKVLLEVLANQNRRHKILFDFPHKGISWGNGEVRVGGGGVGLRIVR